MNTGLSRDQIRLLFFRDLNPDVRLAVFKAFGAYPENCTERLNHGIERHLFDLIMGKPDDVPIPVSVEMARLMLSLAHQYLKERAPEHLAATRPMPVAWAVVAPLGGIHKLSVTRSSADRKQAKWLEEWPNNQCRVRPLVFGDEP